jgi:hypothetical protein
LLNKCPIPTTNLNDHTFSKPIHIKAALSAGTCILVSSTKISLEERHSPFPVMCLTAIPKFDADSFHLLCTNTDFKSNPVSTQSMPLHTKLTSLDQMQTFPDHEFDRTVDHCTTKLRTMPRSHKTKKHWSNFPL